MQNCSKTFNDWARVVAKHANHPLVVLYPPGYQFEFWLLHFHSSTLLVTLGDWRKMAHVLGRDLAACFRSALVIAANWEMELMQMEPGWLALLCTSPSLSNRLSNKTNILKNVMTKYDE